MFSANVFHELHPIVGVRWAKAIAAKHVSITIRIVLRIGLVCFNKMLQKYEKFVINEP